MNEIEAWRWLEENHATIQFVKPGFVNVMALGDSVWAATLLEAVIALKAKLAQEA